MEAFLLVFIPIFIAIDPFGVLPLYLSITDKVEPQEKKALAFQGVATAFGVGVGFALAGHYIFSFIGITAADFQIAGGFLLLIFSTREIFGQTTRMVRGRSPDRFIGIVPLGVPLIAGPAMITTLLILHDQYGIWLIMAGLLVNLIITLLLFAYSDEIIRVVGQGTSRVFAKVAAIFLAAIGIMMIRKGLTHFLLR
jgi:multiple antibiotic resistance protein